MEVRESWTPCFSCRSLLLSTTILNDGTVLLKLLKLLIVATLTKLQDVLI